MRVFPSKQNHQALQFYLTSRFYGEIREINGWISRFGQEKKQKLKSSLSFLSKVGRPRWGENEGIFGSKLIIRKGKENGQKSNIQ